MITGGQAMRRVSRTARWHMRPLWLAAAGRGRCGRCGLSPGAIRKPDSGPAFCMLVSMRAALQPRSSRQDAAPTQNGLNF
ncbi:MAG: hypothetical protein MZV70_71235 [Desulfobacterales bacterium]|nr:hypothetical protein [Desulfobacterales bacterium]